MSTTSRSRASSWWRPRRVIAARSAPRSWSSARKDTVIRGNQIRAAGSHTLGACGYEVGIALGEEFLTTACGTRVRHRPTSIRAPRAHRSSSTPSVTSRPLASPPAARARSRPSTATPSATSTCTSAGSDQCLDTLPLVTSAGTDVRSQLRRLLNGAAGAGHRHRRGCALRVLRGRHPDGLRCPRRHQGQPRPLGPRLGARAGAGGGRHDAAPAGGHRGRVSERAKPTASRTTGSIGPSPRSASWAHSDGRHPGNRLTSSGIGMYLDSVEQVDRPGQPRHGTTSCGIGLLDLTPGSPLLRPATPTGSSTMTPGAIARQLRGRHLRTPPPHSRATWARTTAGATTRPRRARPTRRASAVTSARQLRQPQAMAPTADSGGDPGPPSRYRVPMTTNHVILVGTRKGALRGRARGRRRASSGGRSAARCPSSTSPGTLPPGRCWRARAAPGTGRRSGAARTWARPGPSPARASRTATASPRSRRVWNITPAHGAPVRGRGTRGPVPER